MSLLVSVLVHDDAKASVTVEDTRRVPAHDRRRRGGQDGDLRRLVAGHVEADRSLQRGDVVRDTVRRRGIHHWTRGGRGELAAASAARLRIAVARSCSHGAFPAPVIRASSSASCTSTYSRYSVVSTLAT